MDNQENLEDIAPAVTAGHVFLNHPKKHSAKTSVRMQRQSTPTTHSVMKHFNNFRKKCIKLCNYGRAKANLATILQI